MEQIRVGVVGAGSISQIVHLPVLKAMEQVTVAAICDMERSKAIAVAQKFDIPGVYEQIENMIKKEELDVVHICTTNLYHFPMTYLALNSGLHVFVEKPIALKSRDVAELDELARKQNRHLMVGMQHRFRDDVQVLKEFIRNDELGELFYIKAGWLKKWSKQKMVDWQTKKEYAGGGVLIDLGIQLLDLSLYLLGMPDVANVRMFDFRLDQTINVEDAALALIQTDIGVTITLEMGWRMHLENDSIYTNSFGRKGAAYLNPLRINKELHGNLVNVAPMTATKTSERYKKAYENEIQHFYQVIQGKEKNQSSARDAQKIMQVIEALYLSAEKGLDVKPAQ